MKRRRLAGSPAMLSMNQELGRLDERAIACSRINGGGLSRIEPGTGSHLGILPVPAGGLIGRDSSPSHPPVPEERVMTGRLRSGIMPITTFVPQPARTRAVTDASRLRIFRADIAAPATGREKAALAEASRRVTASGSRVRLLYVRSTYPPAEHPRVALFLASSDRAVAYASQAADVPFVAISEVPPAD